MLCGPWKSLLAGSVWAQDRCAAVVPGIFCRGREPGPRYSTASLGVFTLTGVPARAPNRLCDSSSALPSSLQKHGNQKPCLSQESAVMTELPNTPHDRKSVPGNGEFPSRRCGAATPVKALQPAAAGTPTASSTSPRPRPS